ncbi:MAG: PaaI family thioesterase [Pseudomonadota bacterium]
MSSGAPRLDANQCFVCGPENENGLRLSFRIEDDVCRGSFTSAPHHVGFDGVTHGGIVFAVLDDAMANWFFLQGARGYTAKSEIRYRQPMAVGATIDVECRLLKRKGRLMMLSASATDRISGKITAESDASFMIEEFGDLAPAGG